MKQRRGSGQNRLAGFKSPSVQINTTDTETFKTTFTPSSFLSDHRSLQSLNG